MTTPHITVGMTDEEIEESKRAAAEGHERMMQRIIDGLRNLGDSGFRDVIPVGPISGSTVVPPPIRPTKTTGFRPIDSSFTFTPITMGPLADFDTSIFENYTPTYIDIPQTYYNPNKGLYEKDGKEIIDNTGGDYFGKSEEKGDHLEDGGGYITATDILGPPTPEPPGHPGLSDNQGGDGGGSNNNSGPADSFGADSGDFGSLSHSDGGTIPPVYAQTGYSQEDLKKQLEDMQKAEAAAKAKQAKVTTDAIKGTLGIADPPPVRDRLDAIPEITQPIEEFEILGTTPTPSSNIVTQTIEGVTKDPGGFFKNVFATEVIKKIGEGVLGVSLGGVPGLLTGAVISDNLKKSKKDESSMPPSYGPAYDPSPGNIDPDTKKPITNFGAILGDYSPPTVNLTTTGGLVDYESDFFSDLQKEIEEFDANFKAEQKAKAQAKIDAAIAEAAAINAGARPSQGDGFDTSMGGFTVSDGQGGSYNTDSSGTAGAFSGDPVGMEDEYNYSGGLVYAHSGFRPLIEPSDTSSDFLAKPYTGDTQTYDSFKASDEQIKEFFNSQEYKDFEEQQKSAMNTMDLGYTSKYGLTDTPMSSSKGAAQDRAFELYMKNSKQFIPQTAVQDYGVGTGSMFDTGLDRFNGPGIASLSGNAPVDNPNTPQNEYLDFINSGKSDYMTPYTAGGK